MIMYNIYIYTYCMPFKPIIPLFHYIPPYFTIFQCIP